MPITNLPTIAQQNAMEGTVLLGQMRQDFQQDGGLWASGLTHEELHHLVVANDQENGRYILDTWLNSRLFNGQTRSFPCYAQSHSWYEQDDTYQGLVVGAITGTAGQAEWVLESQNTVQYFQVGQYLMTPRLVMLRIVDVSVAANQESVRVARADGANFAAGDVVVGETLGFISNFYGEGTGQPEGYMDYPYRKSNKLGIVKVTASATGSFQANKMKILRYGGQEVPISNGVWNALRMLRRFRQNALLYSRMSPDGAQVTTPEGILHSVMQESLLSVTYASAAGFGEAELQAFSALANQESPHAKFLWLLGASMFQDVQQIATNYISDGVLMYGSFSPEEGSRLGLNVSGYTYMGVRHDFVHQKDFDDTNVTGSPLNGTPSATAVNFSRFGLALPLGETDNATSTDGQSAGLPLLSYRYRVGPNGQQRNLVGGILKGMTGANGGVIGNGNVAPFVGEAEAMSMMSAAMQQYVATDIDADRTFWLSEIGPRVVKVKTAFGYARAVS